MDRKENGGLPPAAVAEAVLIAAIWGFNFVVIKAGVSGMPPLMLAALRFVLSAFPAILVVKRPEAPPVRVAAYGLLLGVGEFGLLFTALKLGAPAGLSSILLQSQAFFTAAIAAVALKERIRARSVVGMAVAGAGLVLIATGSAGPSAAGGGIAPRLVAMVLLAALAWAGANVAARTMPKVGGLSLMAWSSLWSPLPLAALSLAFEGPRAVGASFASLGWITIGALAYLALLSTLLGYGLWNGLIMRHGASRIAPFSLLVPAFSLASAFLFLGERFRPVDAAGALLILAGLLIHALGGRRVEATPR